MARVGLKPHHTYVRQIILQILFYIPRTLHFEILAHQSLTLCSPSKRQSELVDHWSIWEVLGLVELPHLDANVGSHVEVHVVAAVKDVLRLSFHAEKALSGLNILIPLIYGICEK